MKLIVRTFHVLFHRLAKSWACERGATAIEFAFVAPIILAIMLGVVQVSVVYIAETYLDVVAETAMRMVLTNGAYTLTQAQFNTAICSRVTALFSCSNFIVNLQPVTATTAAGVVSALPQFNSSGALVGATSFNPGNTNDKMLLVVMYQWPVIGGPLGLSMSNMGNGTRLLVSTEVFYKEPCLNASGCQFSG